MIIVTIGKTNYQLKYEGRIELLIEEPYLLVTADKVVLEEDDLPSSSTQIYDTFYLPDVISIIGKE